MNAEAFEKFYSRLATEKAEIVRQINNSEKSISNLSESIRQAITLCSKLNTVWASEEIKVREQLQKVVFPEGIIYDAKIGGFRTAKVNSIFRAIADLARDLGGKEKGTNHTCDDLSPLAEEEGFEPPDL